MNPNNLAAVKRVLFRGKAAAGHVMEIKDSAPKKERYLMHRTIFSPLGFERWIYKFSWRRDVSHSLVCRGFIAHFSV